MSPISSSSIIASTHPTTYKMPHSYQISPVDKKAPRDILEVIPLPLEADPVATPQRWCILPGRGLALEARGLKGLKGLWKRVPALQDGKQDGILGVFERLLGRSGRRFPALPKPAEDFGWGSQWSASPIHNLNSENYPQ